MAKTTKPPLTRTHNEPMIFFDAVPIAGLQQGVANFTLEATRFTTDADGKPATERIIVGHLRTSVAGLRSIAAAAEKALQLARTADRLPTSIQ